MARAFDRSLWAALGLAAALAACASGSVIDKLPGDMGLPAGTPQRPATAYEYPAVHDMPPARVARPLTEEQQVKLEKELDKARDRQEARDAPAKKTAPPPNKKQPATAKNGQATGAQDGVKTNP
jgi:hypothetical protein